MVGKKYRKAAPIPPIILDIFRYYIELAFFSYPVFQKNQTNLLEFDLAWQ